MNIETIVVRVTPNASQNSVTVMEDGVLNVRLTTSPINGKANSALVKLLAKEFGVPQQSIRIVRGLTSKQKYIEIKKNGD